MEESLMYSNVASELLEIFKYLDKGLKEKIPQKLKENLDEIRNKEYKLNIDKTKTLNEQELLPQTRQVLSIIYLKYCCSPEEAKKIIDENYEIKKQKEIEKYEKYNPDNIFKNKEKEKYEKYNPANIFKNKEKEAVQQVQLIKIEDIPWYRKIARNINQFLKNIFGK